MAWNDGAYRCGLNSTTRISRDDTEARPGSQINLFCGLQRAGLKGAVLVHNGGSVSVLPDLPRHSV